MNDALGLITGNDTLRLERTLPGPIERVWEFLTDPDQRATWLAAGPMELRAGGRMELVWRNHELTAPDDRPSERFKDFGGEHRMQATVTRCEPPRLLAFTWGEAGGDPSEVTFELTPQGKSVKLTLTHARVQRRGELVNVSGGWHVHLDYLVARLEGREPPRFWAAFERLERTYQERVPA